MSQLECTAQAGGGMYFPASDAAELSAALTTVFEAPPEPDGRLSVGAVANGEAVDATVVVTPAGGGESVASGRTYTGGETNPRVLAVEPGSYDVTVEPVGIEGVVPVVFRGVEVGDSGVTERTADFSSGELSVRVTRNGAPSDATLRVYRAGTNDEVAAGRTYTSERSNPKRFELSAGTYDVLVQAIEEEWQRQ